MQRFREEARTFGWRKLADIAQAHQLAAMQLVCGIDLSVAMQAGPDLRARLIRRVERVIERERLKGMRRHWSYDLNRHIALKQVLDRLRALEAGPCKDRSADGAARNRGAKNTNGGATRRRQSVKQIGR